MGGYRMIVKSHMKDRIAHREVYIPERSHDGSF
jgi:hypothetical protein